MTDYKDNLLLKYEKEILRLEQEVAKLRRELKKARADCGEFIAKQDMECNGKLNKAADRSSTLVIQIQKLHKKIQEYENNDGGKDS